VHPLVSPIIADLLFALISMAMCPNYFLRE